MDMDYVLASVNPPSVWNFFPTAEAAAAQADEANAYTTRLAAQGAPERHYAVMTYDAYKAAERQEYLQQSFSQVQVYTFRADSQ